jgi:hypothetical protein
MTPRPAVLAIASLVLLFAQVAPAVHEALEAGHDVHACCTDNGTSHIDTCGPDHDHAPCIVCTAGRAPLADGHLPDAPIAGLAEVPGAPPVEFVAVDPFHVDTPDTRGPPA